MPAADWMKGWGEWSSVIGDGDGGGVTSDGLSCGWGYDLQVIGKIAEG